MQINIQILFTLPGSRLHIFYEVYFYLISVLINLLSSTTQLSTTALSALYYSYHVC